MFDYHRQHGIGGFVTSLQFRTLISVHIYLFGDGSEIFVFLLPEIRIARIFNTYGPRMNIDDGRVVSNFIAQAIR